MGGMIPADSPRGYPDPLTTRHFPTGCEPLSGPVTQRVDAVDRGLAKIAVRRRRDPDLAELRVRLDRDHTFDRADAGDDPPLAAGAHHPADRDLLPPGV